MSHYEIEQLTLLLEPFHRSRTLQYKLDFRNDAEYQMPSEASSSTEEDEHNVLDLREPTAAAIHTRWMELTLPLGFTCCPWRPAHLLLLFISGPPPPPPLSQVYLLITSIPPHLVFPSTLFLTALRFLSFFTFICLFPSSLANHNLRPVTPPEGSALFFFHHFVTSLLLLPPSCPLYRYMPENV